MTELNRGAIEAGAEALAQSMYIGPYDPLINAEEWKTLNKYAQAVISAALPKLMPQHEVLTLSAEEQAAADDDFHMSACTLGALECLQCMEELKAIRRHVRAITPIVEQRVHRELEESGRLLPPVGVGQLHWRVREDNSIGIVVGYGSEKEAREDLDRVRDKPQKYILEYRQITYFGEDQPIVEAVGSWQTVETVGGAADEQDHGSFMLTDEAQESGDG